MKCDLKTVVRVASGAQKLIGTPPKIQLILATKNVLAPKLSSTMGIQAREKYMELTALSIRNRFEFLKIGYGGLLGAW